MKSVLGFVVLIALGYLASYSYRKAARKSLLLDQFFASGFPFMLIGVLLGPLFLNVISPGMIRQLDPFLYLALGWVGFIIGVQFEWRLLEHLPKRVLAAAQLEGLVSAGILFGAFFTILWGLSAVLRADRFDIWTGALILTVCGSVSSSLTVHYYAQKVPKARDALGPLQYLISLHVFVPLSGAALLFSFFHIGRLGGVHLPGWLWFLVHVGVGALLGVMMFCLLRGRLSENERLLLILGGVTFSAGTAGYLHISPVVVCFVAGVVYANMPGFNDFLMEVTLRQAERPVYLMMLILAGSLWDYRSPAAWLFLPVFVAVRFAAKGAALWAVSRADRTLRFRPALLGAVLALGPLAIAFLLGYEMLYTGPFFSYIITAILAGTILNEMLSGTFLSAFRR